jgi:hypothetical protein
MAIRITVRDDDRKSPMVFCDYCNQEITRASDGNVEWRALDNTEAFFTHKSCSKPFRKANPQIRNSMELIQFPLRLALNLGIDPDRAGVIAHKLT